jgi:hypothetical protein
VFLNGGNDVFLVIVQNVTLEFGLVGREGFTIISIVKMGG